jgi:hypothetical protein
MPYTLSKAFDIAQRQRATEILDIASRGGASQRQVYTLLQRENLTYGRATVQADYLRAQVIGKSLTDESRARAENFYDTVFTPFKTESGLNATQMGKIMSARKKGVEVPEELQELADQYNAEMEIMGS